MSDASCVLWGEVLATLEASKGVEAVAMALPIALTPTALLRLIIALLASLPKPSEPFNSQAVPTGKTRSTSVSDMLQRRVRYDTTQELLPSGSAVVVDTAWCGVVLETGARQKKLVCRVYNNDACANNPSPRTGTLGEVSAATSRLR